MRKLLLLIGLTTCSLFVSAQIVTNVVATQVGNTVEITYDLDRSAIVTLWLSRDGGENYTEVPRSLSGDIGITRSGKDKKIVWDLMEDGDDWDIPRARFKIDLQGVSELNFTINDLKFTMVEIEGGSFVMGCTPEQKGDCEADEAPAHEVAVSDFYIGKTEVTQALWKAIMGTTVQELWKANAPTSPFKGEGDELPMYYVSWNDCQEFIDRMNKAFGPQLSGMHFALPTEAQWEYAARGGRKKGSYAYKYSGSDILGSIAWFGGNSHNTVHPVAKKNANALGLFDMSGNVFEWCADWYGPYNSKPVADPTGPQDGEYKVYRGGCWLGDDCRVSRRKGDFRPGDRSCMLGFRLVLIKD